MTAASLLLRLRAPALAFGFALALTAGAAAGQTPATPQPAGPVHFGQPGAPYDVSADHQEIFQAENKIVLTGSVEVVQNQSRLRTPQLTLFYNKNHGVKGQPAPVAAGPAGPGAIQRMEAEGPVYFVTPTQSAKGDHGSYDADSDTITLVGNVTLMQDKNVATGEKLVMNQKTGQATLFAGAKTGRVRGVFYSDDKKKPGAAASPP